MTNEELEKVYSSWKTQDEEMKFKHSKVNESIKGKVMTPTLLISQQLERATLCGGAVLKVLVELAIRTKDKS